MTLHSGEGAGWESVQDSILTCGVHRIGHGVRLTENMELLEVCFIGVDDLLFGS